MSDAAQPGALQRVRARVAAAIAPAGEAGPAAALPPVETDLDREELFHIVQNARRRQIVAMVAASDDPVRLGDAAEVIAARECGKSRAELSAQDRKRVYVGLYQCHVPALDEAGVVEAGDGWDPIAPGPELPAAQRLVDATARLFGGDGQ